jgi:sulfur-oxidizing protein SoxA
VAQQPRSTVEEIERYRAALGDGNPAELWEARGEDLWKQKRGPKNASLEKCDLGLGAGVVKGAYTQLPKYFADSDKVEDLESRLVTCMVNLQGFTPADAKKDPFGDPGKKVPMDALVAYITGQSRGMKMNVALGHPKEREAYEIGKKIFFFRGGPHDFACSSCHAHDNQRIRFRTCPTSRRPRTSSAPTARGRRTRVAGRGPLVPVAPLRLFPPAAFPELEFVSPASIALTTYLAYNANGGVFDAPSIKR